MTSRVSPPTTLLSVREQKAPAKAGSAQPSTSGTQPNDPMAQMFLMMQKTFDEQLKFQREHPKRSGFIVTTIRKGS